ncbi:MAG: DNA polymerase III subunit delta' [Actinomycetaceae bacterium]|nr:DNA polymerase III subunit delta' [Actinomycetaceae bacterium]
MSVFDELVGQGAAVEEILRAALAARRAAPEADRGAELENFAENDNALSRGDLAESVLTGSGLTKGGLAGGELAEHSSAMTHAWLFTGPPGSGRSLAAKTLAAALECTGSTPGCGECASCKAVMADNHPDVTTVSTDLVTIKADDVRAYVAQSYVAPVQGAYRIFIVEDADRMLPRTTNVLLKAIEEPAARTVWMLCTAAVADVLPTIRSRCRNINLVTPSPQDVAQLLTARDGVDPEKALVAAQAAQSHIGVARALATDGAAAALRENTLMTLTVVHSVGEAVLAAQLLTDPEKMYATADSGSERSASAASPASVVPATSAADIMEIEQRRRMQDLGLDPDGRVPAAVKSQVAADAGNVKRRQTRMQRDMLDRELIYIESFFRDVMVKQLGADVPAINADFSAQIDQRAEISTLEQTIAAMDACAKARQRLRANVAPVLAIEAALVQLVQ